MRFEALFFYIVVFLSFLYFSRSSLSSLVVIEYRLRGSPPATIFLSPRYRRLLFLLLLLLLLPHTVPIGTSITFAFPFFPCFLFPSISPFPLSISSQCALNSSARERRPLSTRRRRRSRRSRRPRLFVLSTRQSLSETMRTRSRLSQPELARAFGPLFFVYHHHHPRSSSSSNAALSRWNPQSLHRVTRAPYFPSQRTSMGAESPTTTIVAWTKKTPLSVGDDKVVSKVASSSSSSSSSSSRHKASLLLLLCLLLLPIGQKNRFVGVRTYQFIVSYIHTLALCVCSRVDIYIYTYLMIKMMLLCCCCCCISRRENPLEPKTKAKREERRVEHSRPHSQPP